MAEVVELITSLSSIDSIAVAATKLAFWLGKAARKVRSAQDDIETFAGEVSLFAAAMNMAHSSLARQCEAFEGLRIESPALSYMQDRGVLGELVTQSARVTGHIKQMKPRILSLEGSIDIIGRLKWVLFRRSDVLAIRPEMDAVKSSLHLVLAVVSLELAQSSRSRDSSDSEEIKNLRRQIRVLVRTVEHYQRLGDESIRGYETSSTPYSALLNLGQNMARNGTVPPLSRSRQSLPIRSRSQQPQQSNYISTSQPRRNLGISRRLRPTQMERVRRNPEDGYIGPNNDRDSHTDQQTTSSNNDLRSSARASSNETIPDNGQGQTASHATSNSTRPISETNQATSNTQPASTDNRDFATVRPTTNILTLDPSRLVRGEPGYINKSRIQVTAFIDPELNENLISQALAASFGLQFEPHNEDESTLIDFGNGTREQTVGSVKLRWGRGPSSHRSPLHLRCLVCVQPARELIFGRPFLERRRYYWERPGRG